jgi:hypothetical protein
MDVWSQAISVSAGQNIHITKGGGRGKSDSDRATRRRRATYAYHNTASGYYMVIYIVHYMLIYLHLPPPSDSRSEIQQCTTLWGSISI